MDTTSFSRVLPDSDSVILTQLLSTLNESLSCSNKGVWGVLRAIGGGMVKLLASLLVHRLFKGGDVWSVLRFILIRFVYKKTRLSPTNDRDVSILQEYNALFPVPNDEVHVSTLPVYMVKDVGDHVLYTCPFFHSSFMKDLETRADVSLEQHARLATVCRDSNGKVFTPQPLFGSDNYLALAKRVQNYFIRKNTGMISPPIIVLQGAAGLGKTDSFQYLAQLGICGEIRVISLPSDGIACKSFSSILRDLMSKRYTTPTVVYFDEIDKYLDMYISHTYTTAKVSKTQGTSMDEVVDDDYDTFVSSVKKSVVMSIAGLIENWHVTFPGGVVYVFCSNNFHTLFTGVDNTHLNSVKTRFTFIEFGECKKAELCRYLDVYNSKLPKELRYDDVEMKICFSLIRNDISVTYRTIQIVMGMASYDIREFAVLINHELVNPLMDESECPSSSTNRSYTAPVSHKPLTVVEVTQLKENAADLIGKVCAVMIDQTIGDVECMDRVIELLNGYDITRLYTMRAPVVEDNVTVAYTALICLVISYGRSSVLKYFIQMGIDVTWETSDGDNLCLVSIYDLYESCNPRGTAECAHILLSNGVIPFDVNNPKTFELYFINSIQDRHMERICLITELLERISTMISKSLVEKINVIGYLVKHPEAVDSIRKLYSLGFTLEFPGDYINYSLINALLRTLGVRDVNYIPMCELMFELNVPHIKFGGNTIQKITYDEKCYKYKDRITEALTYLFEHGFTYTCILNGDKITIDSIEKYTEALNKV